MAIQKCLYFIALLGFTSCATMLSGKSQKISVISTPIGAEVTVNGKSVGKTPLVLDLKRKEPATVTLKAEGHEPHTTILERKRSGWFWLIPTIYGIPPLLVDVATGAAYRLKPNVINIDFTPHKPANPPLKPEESEPSKPERKNLNSTEAYGTFVDSIIFSENIKEKTKTAKILLEKAQKDYEGRNYSKSRSISLSAWQDLMKSTSYRAMNIGSNKIRIYPSGSRQVTSNTVLLEEGKTRRALSLVFLKSSYALQEKMWDSARWFRYKETTFERWVEFDLLKWYKDVYDLDGSGKGQYEVRYKNNVLAKGPNFTYFDSKGVGSSKGIIKSIKISKGKLIVNMRANPEDMTDNWRGEFKHPLGFMRHLSDFTRQMWTKYEWVSHDDAWRKNRYKAIHEVVFTLYYPGTDGTEHPIGKFGLNRLIGASIDWKDYRVKDGTFQDLLKEKGTYWLHPEIPDMGMPSIH